MDLLDQLFAIRQIRKLGTSHYDTVEKRWIYCAPASFDASALAALDEADRNVNAFELLEHSHAVAELISLASGWGIQEAASAYAASLWSAPWIWRAALTGKAIGSALPVHDFTPFSASSTHICGICGFHEKPTETTMTWYTGMTTGIPIDGHVGEHVILLRELQKLKAAAGTPEPTDYDLYTLARIFDVIDKLPGKTRYSQAAKALKSAHLLPSSSIYAYTSLLESLAIIGILASPDYPGMFTAYTTYRQRDQRPNVHVEVQAPLAWWDSSFGRQQEVYELVFGHLNLDRICLTGEPPTAKPPESETVTGALFRRRMPKQPVPKTPKEAGKGPVQPGDVYAVRVEEGRWVSVFCHEVKTLGNDRVYARCEFLAGMFQEMPTAEDICAQFQVGKNGRWQSWISSLDHTSWVRRIAREIPVPSSEQPVPDRIPFSGANDLKHRIK